MGGLVTSGKLGCSWWLLWLVLSCPGLAGAQTLNLARLAHDAPAAEVIRGDHDAAVVPVPGTTLYERGKGAHWWRIRSDRDIPADVSPQLLLETPYLNRVEAWRPGQEAPTHHVLYGASGPPLFHARAGGRAAGWPAGGGIPVAARGDLRGDADGGVDTAP